MFNETLKLAYSIRKIAKELNEEDQQIDQKVEEKLNKEIQEYSIFLRKFLTIKDNDKILSKIMFLIQNPRIKKPRNAILLMLEKQEETQTPNVTDLIIEIKKLLLRYNNYIERYPALTLLKEILNFGVTNGVAAFKRLLTVKKRLYNTFNTEAN